MTYAVLGEVHYTQMCAAELSYFYSASRNPGTLFEWPSGDCVGICPGTGQRITPNNHSVHLLVACNM
jgi:hypothetical protein